MKKEEIVGQNPVKSNTRLRSRAHQPAPVEHDAQRTMITEPEINVVEEDTAYANSHNIQRLKRHHPHLYHHKILNWD